MLNSIDEKNGNQYGLINSKSTLSNILESIDIINFLYPTYEQKLLYPIPHKYIGHYCEGVKIY